MIIQQLSSGNNQKKCEFEIINLSANDIIAYIPFGENDITVFTANQTIRSYPITVMQGSGIAIIFDRTGYKDLMTMNADMKQLGQIIDNKKIYLVSPLGEIGYAQIS